GVGIGVVNVRGILQPRWRPGRELSFRAPARAYHKKNLRAPPRAAEWGAEETGDCLGTQCLPGSSGLPQSPRRGCESRRAGTSGWPRPRGTPGTPGTEPRDRGTATTEAARPLVRHRRSGERERGGANPP
ncbi:hypothetical protein NDU88_006678, partial [Pleurodeles waltl]